MKNNIVPVILCGGSGTRLWPLSRAGFPKQFLVLSGTTSLFQQAVERANGLGVDDIEVGPTLVVTNEEHRFLALDQLRELKSIESTLLLEPNGRNTAPALTLAALQATANGLDPILVVTPADQTVSNSKAFTASLQQAVRAAAGRMRESCCARSSIQTGRFTLYSWLWSMRAAVRYRACYWHCYRMEVVYQMSLHWLKYW